MSYTPTPWINNGGRIEHETKYGPNVIIATVGTVNDQTQQNTADANRIVHCVNLHDELVDSLKMAMGLLEQCAKKQEFTIGAIKQLAFINATLSKEKVDL